MTDVEIVDSTPSPDTKTSFGNDMYETSDVSGSETPSYTGTLTLETNPYYTESRNYFSFTSLLLLFYFSFTSLLLLFYFSFTSLLLLFYFSFTSLLLLFYFSFTSLLLLFYFSFTSLLLLFYFSFTSLLLLFYLSFTSLLQLQFSIIVYGAVGSKTSCTVWLANVHYF